MAEKTTPNSSEVDRFILNRIDSVPHLEALLLMWRERPRPYSAPRLSKELWVTLDQAEGVLRDLAREGLVVADSEPAEYLYQADPEKDRLLGLVSETYKRELIRISTMIHSKPSASVREFAKAFRLKKED